MTAVPVWFAATAVAWAVAYWNSRQDAAGWLPTRADGLWLGSLLSSMLALYVSTSLLLGMVRDGPTTYSPLQRALMSGLLVVMCWERLGAVLRTTLEPQTVGTLPQVPDTPPPPRPPGGSSEHSA